MSPPDPAGDPHRFGVRVYYEDTDWSGFVYHASYLRFLERGRTEYLRTLGIDQLRLHADGGVAFVVSRLEIDYRRPARMDDELEVTSALLDLRGASMRLAQTVRRGSASLVEAVVTVAAVRDGRPVRLPSPLAVRGVGPAPARDIGPRGSGAGA